jgi:hypothetical protein
MALPVTFTGGSIAVKQSAGRMSDPTRLEMSIMHDSRSTSATNSV